MPLRIQIPWNVHDLTAGVLRVGLDGKVVIKMSEGGVSDELGDTMVLVRHQTVLLVGGHPLLPELVEQGVVTVLVIKQVLVGGPLQHGHLVIGSQEGSQRVEGRGVLLDREVGDDASFPVPEDEAATDKNGDEGNSHRNSSWGYAPPE